MTLDAARISTFVQVCQAMWTGVLLPQQQLQGSGATNESVAALPEGKKVGWGGWALQLPGWLNGGWLP